MKKRLMCLFLALLMLALPLSGCGSNGGRMAADSRSGVVRILALLPDLTTGVECWITAGGAHHSVLSYDVTAEQLRDWARIMDIEFVHITDGSTPEKLEEELLIKDLVWKLR